MRSRAHTSFLFLLILYFLVVDVSESFNPVTPIAKISPYLKKFSRLWPKIKKAVKPAGKKTKDIIGDKVEQLSEVKKYLDYFGYLNTTDTTNNFTEEVQSAIREFQRNYKLNVTGQYDQDFADVLSRPRCAVPDIINGTTALISGEANTTSTSFKPWWKTGEKELSYAFHPQNNLSDAVKSVFREAFNRWSENMTSLNFTETTSFNGSDIKITFVTWDGKGGSVGIVYMNYSIHVGSIYLDADEEWVLSSEDVIKDDYVDLQSVAMHQIGHLLVGLGHSYVKGDTMYPIVLQKSVNLTNGGVASYGMRQRNLNLAFSGGFAFMVLVLFLN